MLLLYYYTLYMMDDEFDSTRIQLDERLDRKYPQNNETPKKDKKDGKQCPSLSTTISD